MGPEVSGTISWNSLPASVHDRIHSCYVDNSTGSRCRHCLGPNSIWIDTTSTRDTTCMCRVDTLDTDRR